MSAPFRQAVLTTVAFLGLVSCAPTPVTSSSRLDQNGLLPAGVADALAQRRMNIIWAPEMSTCGVCNAPVSEALSRFAVDYPEAGVVTALIEDEPFPAELVVGKRVVVAAPDASKSHLGRRPYLAILDADGQLLGWRRIPDFGPQSDFVYQDLLGAFSLTAPLE